MTLSTKNIRTAFERFDTWLQSGVSPYPLAIFRIIFYCGLALHFGPSLLAFSDNFAPDAVRRGFLGDSHFALFLQTPTWVIGVIAFTTTAAILAGIAGFFPRTVAAVTLFGTYTLAGFNSLYLIGFVAYDAFGILLLWIFTGGGTQVLSADVWLGNRLRQATRLFGALLVIRIFAGSFISGISKLLAGWPMTNVGHDLLRYPGGFVMRDWAAGLSIMDSSAVGFVLTLVVLVAELLIPLALVWRDTRKAGLIYYLCYVSILLVLFEASLLYFAIHYGVALFLLPEATWQKNPGPAAQPPHGVSA